MRHDEHAGLIAGVIFTLGTRAGTLRILRGACSHGEVVSLRLSAALTAAIAFVALPALAAPEGPFARVDLELGLQQLDIVQRDRTPPGYPGTPPTVRLSGSEAGTAYGIALTGGLALRPWFALAVRGHIRSTDMLWQRNQDSNAGGSPLVEIDFALEMDAQLRAAIPLRLQLGLGPRWMALGGGSNAVACATCVYSFDGVGGMSAYVGIGLEASCRKSPCFGVMLLVDAAYGIGGHAADPNAGTPGTTRIDTYGTSVVGTVAFE